MQKKKSTVVDISAVKYNLSNYAQIVVVFYCDFGFGPVVQVVHNDDQNTRCIFFE